jgi:hypothetical protein
MAGALITAVVLAAAFSFLIACIEVHSSAKVSELQSSFTPTFFVYVLVLLIGNIASTLVAATIVTPPKAVAGQGSANVTTQPTNNAFFALGPAAFWYAFLGVFAFEALLQRVNLTISNQPVLTIHDWITKAKDAAVAASIEKQASTEQQRVQDLARRLARQLTPAEMNTHVLNLLGVDKVAGLEQAATANNADLQLYKALALATIAYAQASKLI